MRIGLFDSGVGGLSVLRRLSGLRAAEFVYLADTARCPYGDRAPEEIISFAGQVVGWLRSQAVHAIIMACNTSAATAGPIVRGCAGLPVHDLIEPAARYLSGLSKKVAVLATASTVRSRAFSQAVARHNPSARVVEIACPELVPLIERGELRTAASKDALWRYVKDLEGEQVGAVVLGCTHYPFLSELLAGLLPAPVELVDPAEHLWRSFWGEAGDCAAGAMIDHEPTVFDRTKFFVTGSTDSFAQVAALCLGCKPFLVEHVAVEELAVAKPVEPVVREAIVSDVVSSVVTALQP